MAAAKDSGIFVEDQLGRRWDKCITDGFLKLTGGFVIGAVFSVLFFKKRKWPMLMGSGFGIGMAYANCERDVNALLNKPEC